MAESKIGEEKKRSMSRNTSAPFVDRENLPIADQSVFSVVSSMQKTGISRHTESKDAVQQKVVLSLVREDVRW